MDDRRSEAREAPDAPPAGGARMAVGHAGGWIPPVFCAPACGARTRAGNPCHAPAVRGKRRCRMHGGALGSGAPRGNRNAFKHGWWSAAERAERRRVAALRADAERLLGEPA